MQTQSPENAICHIITSDTGHYSVWPLERETPRGWRSIGAMGSARECVEYIEALASDYQLTTYRRVAPQTYCNASQSQV